MAAYGAVVSLLQTFDTMLHPDRHLPTSLDRIQLESLHEKVSFLQQFLENPLSNTGNAGQSLETKIRDAAFKAELIIESEIYNLLVPEPENQRKSRVFSSLFVAAQLVIFVLVGSLCHYAIERFVPAHIQRLFHQGLDLLVGMLILHVLTAFMDQILAELKSQFRQLISIAMQYLQRNSETEAQDLDQVMKEVSSVMNEVIKIDENQYSRNVFRAASSSRVDSVVTGNNVVVGFESDLLEVKTMLNSESSNLEIVSIVGMGGIGKTTLARQVYDDSYVNYHFDIRAWITTSQEYSLRQVLRGLLDSAGMLTEKMSERSEQELGLDLYQSLMGRRYLIVMDDTWDTEIWDHVRRFLPEDNNGSRVVLTTRLSKVAVYANSSSPFYQMRFLDQDQSWELLCHTVFGDKVCPSELQELGKEIARRCGGLPLAIAVTGGLLFKGDRTQECWRSIADNLISVVDKEDEEQYMEILHLSYENLPHCLRPCFLYMGMFPEDYEIHVPKLIRLWVAEGFLKPDRSTSLEDLADEYLEDLVERNLIMVCKRRANGKMKTCSIHDVLRDLCMRKAHTESFLYVVKRHLNTLEEGTRTAPRNRLCIHTDSLRNGILPMLLHEIETRSSSLHSLLCTGRRRVFPSRLYLGYRFLRVLDLAIVGFSYFPDEILKLVYLRYLALTYHNALPPSISKLCNLQTIVHYNWLYTSYLTLPEEIWMMPKLRHICVSPSFIADPCDNSCLLENLETLSEVRNLICSNSILERTPNLKKLGISYDVPPFVLWSEYRLEALVNFHQLETLKLVVNISSHVLEIGNAPKLAFPHKLKSLTLIGCAIPWTTMSDIGALPNLEVLKLKNNACVGSEWEPVEEEFCRLKYLLLERLDVVHWRADETHFPLLQRLIIRSCYELDEIPSAIGDVPTIEMIELVDCRPPVVNSAREIEEEQQSMGNMVLKVDVRSNRLFKYKRHSSELL